MKGVLIIVSFFFYSELIFADIQDMRSTTLPECPVAESILLDTGVHKQSAALSEKEINTILQQKSMHQIVQDLEIFSTLFEKWVSIPVPEFQMKIEKTDSEQELTTSESKIQQHRQRRNYYYKHMKPIMQYDKIIRLEMRVIANSYETNAMPYIKRLAGVKLPDSQFILRTGIPNRIQMSAANCWLSLSMPQNLTAKEKKAWLLDFIKSEEAKGNQAKEWAIEAAELMLWRMKKEDSDSSGTVKNNQSE
jgi:hypothetical protein